MASKVVKWLSSASFCISAENADKGVKDLAFSVLAKAPIWGLWHKCVKCFLVYLWHVSFTLNNNLTLDQVFDVYHPTLHQFFENISTVESFASLLWINNEVEVGHNKVRYVSWFCTVGGEYRFRFLILLTDFNLQVLICSKIFVPQQSQTSVHSILIALISNTSTNIYIDDCGWINLQDWPQSHIVQFRKGIIQWNEGLQSDMQIAFLALSMGWFNHQWKFPNCKYLACHNHSWLFLRILVLLKDNPMSRSVKPSFAYFWVFWVILVKSFMTKCVYSCFTVPTVCTSE